MKTAMIILAAGASSRMGTHKALLELDGEALVVRAVRVAREAGCAPLVVLGAEAARIVPLLRGCEHVVNHAWEEGMGGSIACGRRPRGLPLRCRCSCATTHRGTLIRVDWDGCPSLPAWRCHEPSVRWASAPPA